jgi:hypothetical protein
MFYYNIYLQNYFIFIYILYLFTKGDLACSTVSHVSTVKAFHITEVAKRNETLKLGLAECLQIHT